MSDERSVWEVRLGVYATRQQADEIKEQITRMLCPDAGHAPPCPVPWSVMTLHGSALDEEDPYPELVEQARIEQPGGDGARS